MLGIDAKQFVLTLFSERGSTVVGPENSCGAPKVVMVQSMGRWELDYLALFGWMDRSAVG